MVSKSDELAPTLLTSQAPTVAVVRAGGGEGDWGSGGGMATTVGCGTTGRGCGDGPQA
jgi:hypothetical protein